MPLFFILAINVNHAKWTKCELSYLCRIKQPNWGKNTLSPAIACLLPLTNKPFFLLSCYYIQCISELFLIAFYVFFQLYFILCCRRLCLSLHHMLFFYIVFLAMSPCFNCAKLLPFFLLPLQPLKSFRWKLGVLPYPSAIFCNSIGYLPTLQSYYNQLLYCTKENLQNLLLKQMITWMKVNNSQGCIRKLF